jgi:hypothetical protein
MAGIRRSLTTAVAAAVALIGAGCTGPPARTGPPAPSPTRDHGAIVADLLGRPLRAPPATGDGACPAGQRHGATSAPLGPWGDLNLKIDFRTPEPDGLYDLKVIWGSSADYQGPIAVRVASVDGRGHGAVRLYYHPGASLGDAVIFTLAGVDQDWPSGTFVSGPGCYAYQIDGLDLRQEIIFSVTR